MRIEIKAFGRNAKRDVRDLCGALNMRADSEDDAEYLALLQRVVQYPDLLSILLALGEAVIDKKITAEERRQLSDICARVTQVAKMKGGGK